MTRVWKTEPKFEAQRTETNQQEHNQIRAMAEVSLTLENESDVKNRDAGQLVNTDDPAWTSV